MSLNIRGSAPAGEQPWNTGRSPSNDRQNATTITTTTINSTTTNNSPQYTRPEVQVRNPDPDPSLAMSGTSVFSSEPQQARRPGPPAKLLRFKTPTLQIRPRQDEPPARRKSPEPFTPRGPYASESDNESLGNSSTASISTQATSVISDEDVARDPVNSNHIRPSTIARRQSVSAGPSRRQIEYHADSSQDQGRVLHIQIKSKQQQQQKALPPANSKAASSSRRTPMITQAPLIAQRSESATQQQLTALHRQGASGHESDTPSMLFEIDTLRGEVNLLRSKESQATRELEDIHQRLNELQKDKDELRSEKTKLQAAKDQLEKDIEKQSKQLDKTRDKFDDQKKTVERLEQERDSKLEKAKKERAVAIQRIHKERDQTQEKIEKDHEAALKKLEQERDQLVEEKNGLDGKLKTVEEHLGRFREINDNLRTNYEALEKETKQNTDNKGETEAKTINLERELNDTVAIQKAQENSYKAQIARLEISLEARELRVKNLEDELNKSDAKGAELTSERDKLKVELETQKSHMETLEKGIAGLGEDKVELQKHLESLRQDKTSLEESLEANKEEQKKELSSKDSCIANLEGENQGLQTQLESVREEQKSAEKKVEELEAEHKKLQEQAESLNNEVEQLRKEQDDTSSEVGRLKEECDGLRNENESLRASSEVGSQAAQEETSPDPAETAARVQELQERNTELEARNTELQAKAADIEQQLEKEKEALDSAENEVGTLHQRLANLTVQLNSNNNRGRTKKKRNPKKAEKILAVRCPRDTSREISIVRRKNIHQVQSLASMSDSTNGD